ncbi:hypothetical protein Ccel01_30480 [Cellulosimicrobium cellulans]|uniref:Uncharacterized protein n=1 Tax=Cellulosimicrobium cellulans TaxID=1710 RepID=A0AAV5PB91_CELCE|nr:hypothetical protein Ccel01_30480 [Cellulosimicrobium cellulans]
MLAADESVDVVRRLRVGHDVHGAFAHTDEVGQRGSEEWSGSVGHRDRVAHGPEDGDAEGSVAADGVHPDAGGAAPGAEIDDSGTLGSGRAARAAAMIRCAVTARTCASPWC